MPITFQLQCEQEVRQTVEDHGRLERLSQTERERGAEEGEGGGGWVWVGLEVGVYGTRSCYYRFGWLWDSSLWCFRRRR